LTFASLSAGYFRTCGVTTSGTAYCWGSVVGDSTITNRLVPTPVAGGLTFASVSAGVLAHTCGVTTGGVAYCWGGNLAGELGDGTTNMPEFVPTPVAGSLTFTTLSAGPGDTCGVTTSGAAYCWGYNAFGQLGDGTTISRLIPTPVTGGLTFAVVSAGVEVETGHACGVTRGGAA